MITPDGVSISGRSGTCASVRRTDSLSMPGKISLTGRLGSLNSGSTNRRARRFCLAAAYASHSPPGMTNRATFAGHREARMIRKSLGWLPLGYPGEVVPEAKSLHESHHTPQRETHDRKKIPIDPLDDRRPVPLNPIGARLVHRLFGGEVRVDVGWRQVAKRHCDRLHTGFDAAAALDGDGSEHRVRAPAEKAEHAGGIVTVPGLPQHHVIDDDDRIRSDHDRFAMPCRNRGGFLASQPLSMCERDFAREIRFVDVGGGYFVRATHHPQPPS